jgi:hypothetical protein
VCSLCMIFYTISIKEGGKGVSVDGADSAGYIPTCPHSSVLICHMSVLHKTVSLPIPALQGLVTECSNPVTSMANVPVNWHMDILLLLASLM